MSKKTNIMAVLFIVFSLVTLVGLTELQAKEKVICPVSGKEIKSVEDAPKYEYKGKTYYFCCDGCKEAFMKDPEKHLQADAHAHAHPEDAAYDPVCNMKVKKEEAAATHEYDGKTYYFCMEQCKEKFVQNPEKYIQKQKEQYTTCPVSGEKVRKSETAITHKYNGKTYYFCCENCKEKFVKDPGKYVKKDEGNNGNSCSHTENQSCCAAKKIKKD